MAADAYPSWRFFPSFTRPPDWVADVVGVFEGNQAKIQSTARGRIASTSDAVLAELAGDLKKKAGFKVETGKKKSERLERPVMFGERGEFARASYIDGFQEENGIALEVEAGRSIGGGGAVYRDLIRASLMLDVRFLVIAVPLAYRTKSAKTGRISTEPVYRKAVAEVEEVYASPRLDLPFEGLLLIGY